MPEMWEMQQRRYSIAGEERLPPPSRGMVPSTSEDLHAWSIYRQNLNSDFTDSALGSSEKSPLPYGNFQLRESTVQSILSHPRYGPKSPLGANMYTYLKFGLPRVFPPNQGPGGTSSGYNSSEEDLRGRRNRSRSEADFANLHYHPVQTLGGGKSLSHADLLSAETLLRQSAAQHRRSLHDLRHTDYLHHALMRQPQPGRHQGQMSGRMRRMSAVQSGVPSPEPFSFSMLHPQQYTGLYPHLQVRNLNVRNRKGEPMINNLSTEVKAGEILSVMATSCDVGTCMLECLAGRHSYSGQVSVNGQIVSPKDLRGITALVDKDTVLHGDFTVSGCLRYYASLRRPQGARGKLSMADQVAIVTDELGLCPVLDTMVSKLTHSEYSRLLVALQLLSDPQILLVDDVTNPMDIFDTFFLVEFLRYWAAGATGGVAGRVVVMCLQPPTYEILTMVTRLLILSGCDTMYDGPSRSLGHYFTPVQCPAPAYKNPADYYLDLVTLDDLSAEAMLESSQRVDQLAGLYRRRQTPLSDPAPYTLPAPFKRPGIFAQAFTLLLKDAFFSQPVSFTRWIVRVIIAALVSVIVGGIFWDIPTSDPQLRREERLGYHFTVLCVMSWPLVLILGLSRTHDKERQAVESDIHQGLYSRLLYIILTFIYSCIPCSLVWLAYLIPSYCMSGLYDQGFMDNLVNYLCESVLCLLSLQYLCTLVGYVCPSRVWSAVVYTMIHSAMSGFSGFTLDLRGAVVDPGRYTPVSAAYSALLAQDHDPVLLKELTSHMVCRKTQVQRQDIIVHLPCPVPNGTAALAYRGISAGRHGGMAVSASWMGVTLLLALLVFLVSPLLYDHRKKLRRR
ncbi:ABC transporter G family member 1 [Cimex lectularius]|uniref:ABC Transporter n=1 Tax=Cimex lectularius TaxID=79782 RepID=A0A8I6TE98_CIMLE|nr:ABC transporter G family member 1 [Cimex lectularius]